LLQQWQRHRGIHAQADFPLPDRASFWNNSVRRQFSASPAEYPLHATSFARRADDPPDRRMTVSIVAWVITALSIAGMIVRPFGWPEYIWAIAGAVLVVLIGAVPTDASLGAAAKGTDVYLFLIGMMLLSEVAREEGLFDYLAVLAVRSSGGSKARLFAIVYAVGTIVTIFLSNDATAVVLTPAVAAATRTARVEPLPYLFICAFIANAASFVLPISNPANLVLYGDHMPALPLWLAQFAVPSILAIGATFVALRLTQAKDLRGAVDATPEPEPLSRGGRLVAAGIVATAVVLLVASTLGWQLGLPTFIMGVLVAIGVLTLSRQSPLPALRHISWGVLPLVAGLFILVEGLDRTGVLALITGALKSASQQSELATAAVSGVAVAFGTNLVNNLPLGLVAASTSHAAQVPIPVTNALLIGVDLGPNLSVTGSLATILWLIALRREGIAVSSWKFLKLGLIVMPPALVLALGAVLAQAMLAG
jgi:arsenical pump membrane protein